MLRRILIFVLVMLVGAATVEGQQRKRQGRRAVAKRTSNAPVETARSLAQLRSLLDAAVDRPGWREDQWSILAVDLDTGDTLYMRTPEQALAPASSLKLFTTAAALEYLGPDYRYKTFLLVDGPVENGVLKGDVYLYGTGDPTIGKRFAPRPAEMFYAFADTLAMMGIQKVDGRIIGDGSYFAGQMYGTGWEQNYLNAWYAAPASALSTHENLVRLEIRPGPPGSRPIVDFVPGGNGIAIVNNAVSGRSGGIVARRTSYDSPIVIDGSIRGRTATAAVPVADPPRYTAALFRDVLIEKGIQVTGPPEALLDPAKSPITSRTTFAPKWEKDVVPQVVAVHLSEPLREILTIINHQSHNLYAEHVLRTVGQATGGDGSPESGVAAVRRMLLDMGGDTSGITIVDGSGLSPLNRVNARAFITLLTSMARSPLSAEFDSTLNVAGRDTHFRRMRGTPAEGNLRAKTGTIDHVSALAGYVKAHNGENIAFSIISNNVPSTAPAKYIENIIGATLASYGGPGPVLPRADEPTEEDEQRGEVLDTATTAVPAARARRRPS